MLKNYPGAKSQSGIIQFLVNEIPFHERYFELFAGSAQLFKGKKPAPENLLNDISQKVVHALEGQCRDIRPKGIDVMVWNLPAIEILNDSRITFSKRDFIYLDPPYPAAARRSGNKLYKHEMLTDADHIQLLTAVRTINANVMISTSPNDLYDQVLHDWRKLTFETMGHQGPRTEVIYMNYPAPEYLHQYDMLGADCWQRQKIKIKVNRFAKKMQSLPSYQKHLLIQSLIKSNPAAVQHFLAVAAGT